MKKKLMPFIVLLIIFSGAAAKNIKASLFYKTFYSPEKGPYIETYLSVSGKSVEYVKNASGKFQGKIEVILTFKQNEEVKYFDKYFLLSPEVPDTINTQFNFIDAQRIQLNNGKYSFEISIADKNSNALPYKHSRLLDIEYFPNIVSISDIELVESYKKSDASSALVKNGYEIIPYVNDFYPDDIKTIKFYAEVYNSNKISGESFLVTYHIETAENKKIIERGFKKQAANDVNIILSEISMADLPSGNYNLVIEARNKKNEIIAFEETFFQRSNNAAAENQDDKINQAGISQSFVAAFTKDSLKENIRSLRPVADRNEIIYVDNQVKISDLKSMQHFFMDFWSKRDKQSPEEAWLKYAEQVRIANAKFSALNRKGYETDRGRVFLQYGAPDAVQEAYREPSAYPYEVWQYYKLRSESNRKFIFYNPDLISNDFTLLHSDAKGEISENQWQLKLHKRDTQTYDLDHDHRVNGFGNNADQNFKNPR